MRRAVLLPTVVVALLMLLAPACGPTAEWRGRDAAADPHDDLDDHEHDDARQPAQVLRGQAGRQPGRDRPQLRRAASEIVRLNHLADGGQTLQIGQILEIPTDVVMVVRPAHRTAVEHVRAVTPR